MRLEIPEQIENEEVGMSPTSGPSSAAPRRLVPRVMAIPLTSVDFGMSFMARKCREYDFMYISVNSKAEGESGPHNTVQYRRDLGKLMRCIPGTRSRYLGTRTFLIGQVYLQQASSTIRLSCSGDLALLRDQLRDLTNSDRQACENNRQRPGSWSKT